MSEQALSEGGDVYVVETARGFATLPKRTIETLETLGLIRHQHDGHVLQDGAGNGVGALHRFYGGGSK